VFGGGFDFDLNGVLVHFGMVRSIFLFPGARLLLSKRSMVASIAFYFQIIQNNRSNK